MDEKRAQLKKYFKPFPKWAVWLIVIGAPLVLAKGIGLVLIGIGAWAIFAWSQKPTDQQVDLWIEEDLKGLNSKALAKSGTDQSELVGETVQVTGPRFWNVGGAEVSFKKGKDNFLRFTPIGVSVINFTASQLVVYQCALDLGTGNPLNEGTDEYFYRDVVSVSTQSKTKTLHKGDLPAKGLTGALKNALDSAGTLQLNDAETFVLTTSGGTSVEVVLRDRRLIDKMGGGDIPTTTADKAIQSVRKMLRERKSA